MNPGLFMSSLSGSHLTSEFECGCRLVVSDMPTTKDSLDDISFVRIVPQKDVEALAAAIDSELSKVDELLLFDGARLVRRFGWDSIAERYLNILKDMQTK